MGREIVTALIVAGILGGSGTAAASKKDQPTHRAAQAALQYFESVHDADFEAFLRQKRRPAPSPLERAMVIKNLAKEGELTPTAQEAAKLAAIRPLLVFHGRDHDMEIRLIAGGGRAFVGVHARTVLLVSRETLDLLETDELVAIMAHELGHDYVWSEYEKARQKGGERRLQELELECDGIAVIAIGRLGVDSEHFVSAVTKLTRHNDRLGTLNLNYAWYVSLDERVRFIRAVARLTASARGV
jgi:peptidase M48-like protein